MKNLAYFYNDFYKAFKSLIHKMYTSMGKLTKIFQVGNTTPPFHLLMNDKSFFENLGFITEETIMTRWIL